MRGVAGNDLLRRKLVVAIPIVDEARAVRGDAVEVQIGIGLEALRLLIVSSGVGIASGKPGPRPEHLIALPAIDDDGRDGSAQSFHHSSPSVPLRVAAAGKIEPGVVKRIAGDSRALLKRNQVANEIVLEVARFERGIGGLIPFAGGPLHQPGRICSIRHRGIDIGEQSDVLLLRVCNHFRDIRRNRATGRVPLSLANLLAEVEPQDVFPTP